MRIYVAAMYSLRSEMVKVHEALVRGGHEPTSRWVDGAEENMSSAEAAVMDMEDVYRADALLAFTYDRGKMFSGGGRHVELGMALAWGKRVFIVGGLENVFCYHPCVTQVQSVEEFLQAWPPASVPSPLPLPSLKALLDRREPSRAVLVDDAGGGP